jgi:hypothetical protein
MNIFLSRNDELRLATLKACFVIGKHRKPFSDGEFIKPVVLAVEPENRLFRDVPLSNDTVPWRIQELCIFIRNEIAQCVNKSPFFSLCLDESNDITKTAQIIVRVRYFDVDKNLIQLESILKFNCFLSMLYTKRPPQSYGNRNCGHRKNICENHWSRVLK